MVDHAAEERRERRESDHEEDEQTRRGDEEEIDGLRMGGRSASLHLARSLEADPDRPHHPRRPPEERDEGDETDCGERACDALDRLLHVGPADGRAEEVGHLVDDPLAELLVLEHEAEDRDEEDGQRKERK